MGVAMRAIFVAPVAIVAVAALTGPAEASHGRQTISLEGRLTCTAGAE